MKIMVIIVIINSYNYIIIIIIIIIIMVDRRRVPSGTYGTPIRSDILYYSRMPARLCPWLEVGDARLTVPKAMSTTKDPDPETISFRK